MTVIPKGDKMKRIYVAGPYSASDARKVRQNVDKAIEVGCALIRKGWAPFIPHLSHYIWMHPDGDFSYETWTEMDMEWVRVCPALYYISPSPGADAEFLEARKLGHPIYRSLEDVPDLTKEVSLL